MFYYIYFLLLYASNAVVINFEKNEAAFFVRQLNLPSSTLTSNIEPDDSLNENQKNDLLSLDQFIVTKPNEPVSVRATYGPFSSKQSVPLFDFNYPLIGNNTATRDNIVISPKHQLNVGTFSMHFVGKSEISIEKPTLRVLFHQNERGSDVCAMVEAKFLDDSITVAERSLKSHCSPNANELICLIQITIPADWWPSIQRKVSSNNIIKEPVRSVELSYSLLNVDSSFCTSNFLNQQVLSHVHLETVYLIPTQTSYKEVQLSEHFVLLLPSSSIYSLTRILVPIFYDSFNEKKFFNSITLRARIKNGLKILRTYPGRNSEKFWNVTSVINSKKMSITVKIIPKINSSENSYPQELQWWLLEIDENAHEHKELVRIMWNIKTDPVGNSKKHRRRPFIDFDVQKDDIQAIVPISKTREILNTAVLNGHQVSQSLKVYTISYSGKASDVTLQSSCYSENESVIKVSSSCSSVFVDGSENQGSLNGSILIKYGPLSGLAKFTVWIPEFPLDIRLADPRLSQIKGWKVVQQKLPKYSNKKRVDVRSLWSKKLKIHTENTANTVNQAEGTSVCKLRFQQTLVEVYARFLATDVESGHTSYLINHRTVLKVTDLTTLRLSDPTVATIQSNRIQGRNIGRTEVQVIGPFSANILASAEFRVTGDRVGIANLTSKTISGLQMDVKPDHVNTNRFQVETRILDSLTAKYQEALLDLTLILTDGSKLPLRSVSEQDYQLFIETYDPSIVAIAPSTTFLNPRIIAINNGVGNLIKVSLALSNDCKGVSKNFILATKKVPIRIELNMADDLVEENQRTEFPQNDGDQEPETGKNKPTFVTNVGIPMSKNNQFLTASARNHRNFLQYPQNLVTPFEVGMYVLLVAFVCGLLIFVAACVVYASKFKPIRPNHISLNGQSELNTRRTTTNAHDWVWLGRSTFDSSNFDGNNHHNNGSDIVRITENPLVNYREPSDAIAISDHCNVLRRHQSDCRPPVPPHRNIGVVPLPKRHKRHKSHKNHENKSFELSEAFHFDDLGPVTFQSSQNQRVENQKNIIKKANIVDNSMFSSDNMQQIEMDYQQIMHHFHNLKESNA